MLSLPAIHFELDFLNAMVDEVF